MPQFPLYLCAYGRLASESHIFNKKSMRLKPIPKVVPKKTAEEKKAKDFYTAADYYGAAPLKGGKNFLTIQTDASGILPAMLTSFLNEVTAALPELMQVAQSESSFDEVLLKRGGLSKFIILGVGSFRNLTELPDFNKAKTDIEAECQSIVPKGQDFAKVQFVNSYCCNLFNNFLKVLAVHFAYILAFQSSASIDETTFASVLFTIAAVTKSTDTVDLFLDRVIPQPQPVKPFDFHDSPSDFLAVINANKQREEAEKKRLAELAKAAETSSIMASVKEAEAKAAALAAAPTLPTAQTTQFLTYTFYFFYKITNNTRVKIMEK